MEAIAQALFDWIPITAPIVGIAIAVSLATYLAQVVINGPSRRIDDLTRQKQQLLEELATLELMEREKPKRESEKRKRTYALGDDGELIEVESYER